MSQVWSRNVLVEWLACDRLAEHSLHDRRNRLAYRIGLTAPVTRDEQRQVDTGFRAFAGRGRRLHDD